MDEDFAPVYCVRDAQSCKSATRDACATRALWVAVGEEIEDALTPLTIASLAACCQKEGVV